MDDTTAVTVIVHYCPPVEVRAVSGVLGDFGLTEMDELQPDRLTLGASYGHSALACGTVDTLAERLSTAASAAAWTLAEAPRYEHPGTVVRHVPGLGIWRGRHGLSAAGAPLVSVGEVCARASNPEALRRLLGTDWHVAVATMSPGVVIAPRLYTATWRPVTGEVTVAGWVGPPVPITTELPTPAVLAAAGWRAVGSWTATATGHHGEVCRLVEACWVPFRACARCRDLITDPENAPAGTDALCCGCGDYDVCCEGRQPRGAGPSSITLLPPDARSADGCDCWPLPGVVAPMNDPSGVQACGVCTPTVSDLDAAQQLAAAVGGCVRFYLDDPADRFDDAVQEGEVAAWLARRQVGTYRGPGDTRGIAGRTDPWVEVDGVPVAWAHPTWTPAAHLDVPVVHAEGGAGVEGAW